MAQEMDIPRRPTTRDIIDSVYSEYLRSTMVRTDKKILELQKLNKDIEDALSDIDEISDSAESSETAE